MAGALDDLRHQVEALFDRRRDRLEACALVGLGHLVGAQPLDGVERVGHGRDVAGVGRIELFDEGEDVGEVTAVGRHVGLVQLEPGEVRDVLDLGTLQRHTDLRAAGPWQRAAKYHSCLLAQSPARC